MKPRCKAERIELANRISQLNEMLGTTSSDLITGAGISGPMESRMDGTDSDAGSIPDRDLKKICNTFGVSPEWLLEGKGKPFINRDKKVPAHCYNVFTKESNGVYKYVKTYKQMKKAVELVHELRDKDNKRPMIIETDVPIKVYKEIKLSAGF